MEEPEVLDLIIAKQVHIRIFRGDRRPIPMILTRKDTGGPFDLTGIQVHMHVRAKPDDSVTLAQFAIGTGLSVSGTFNNILTILSLGDLPAKRSYYDLQLTFPDGQVVTYFYGQIGGIPDSTRVV